MNAKPWYLSKTIWFNVITGALELIQALGGVGLLPPGVLAVAVHVGNCALRLITSQPIAARK